MDSMDASSKEKDRERENENTDRDREREKEKEKEKEGDVEAALYTNCLLLGFDPNVLGPGVGNRAGLFRHSNPRLGEALLHFLMCALRGPNLSAKVLLLVSLFELLSLGIFAVQRRAQRYSRVHAAH